MENNLTPPNKLKKGAPIFELTLDGNELDGIYGIAITSAPAIERNWVALNSDKKQEKVLFRTLDEKRTVTGPLLVPDQLIYREDPEVGAYFVTMNAQTIEQAAKLFSKRGFHSVVNVEHEKPLEGMYMFESWIVNENSDKARALGYNTQDIPAGTWMATYAVENDVTWQRVKAGEFVGFSIEGLFSSRPFKASVQAAYSTVRQELDEVDAFLHSDADDLSKFQVVEAFITKHKNAK